MQPRAGSRSPWAAISATPGASSSRRSAGSKSTLGPLVVAPLYLTEPVSAIAQPPFFNTVVIGTSDLAAERLLALTQQVELDFGRERNAGSWPKRRARSTSTCSCWARSVRSGAAPLLPHPRLRERRFVLAPLCDVAPDWRIPPDGATACELLSFAYRRKPWVRAAPRTPFEAPPRTFRHRP